MDEDGAEAPPTGTPPKAAANGSRGSDASNPSAASNGSTTPAASTASTTSAASTASAAANARDVPRVAPPARRTAAAKPQARSAAPAKPQAAASGDGTGPAVSSVGRTRRGLPKRLVAGDNSGAMRIVPPAEASRDTGTLSAAELRRQLTGFQEGLEAARREGDATDPVGSSDEEPTFPPDAREETGGGDR